MANRAAMWKQDESGRVHTPLEPVVLGATLALIPVLIVRGRYDLPGVAGRCDRRELDPIYPKTVQGRLIGMVLMFVGIGFLSFSPQRSRLDS